MDRKFLRPGWIVGHLLVAVAVLVCLRLGRWQWHRMHEGGTIQNFGYAVLWPVFGAAFVYMWFRFLQLEKLKDAEDDAELTALAAGVPADPAQPDQPPHHTSARAPGSPDAAVSVGDEPAADSVDLPVRLARSVPVARIPPDEPRLRTPDDGDDRAAPAPSNPAPAIPAPTIQAPTTSAPTTAASAPTTRASRNTPSTGVTVAVATVGDDDDDPELAAYNRALAALAEKDHRRAR